MMEQRSQILKQMHLTKNEREREVRSPQWDSQSLKLLPALGLLRSRTGQVWDWHRCLRLSHPYSPHQLPALGSSAVGVHTAVVPAQVPSQLSMWGRSPVLCEISGRIVDAKYARMTVSEGCGLSVWETSVHGIGFQKVGNRWLFRDLADE